jgi:CheY-like chemotaxis protein
MNTEPNPLRFAIVEDEPFMAQLVRDMLVSEGVGTEVFLRGQDLLASPDLLKFKAIILDLSLPDMDGFEIMDRLADEALGVSLVLMSGHEMATVRAAELYGNGIGLRVDTVLRKPFTRAELLLALGLPT